METPHIVIHFFDIWDSVYEEAAHSDFDATDPQQVTDIGNTRFDINIGETIRGKDSNGLRFLIQRTIFGNIGIFHIVDNYDEIEDEDVVHFRIAAPREFFDFTCYSINNGLTPDVLNNIFGTEEIETWGNRTQYIVNTLRAEATEKATKPDSPNKYFNKLWETISPDNHYDGVIEYASGTVSFSNVADMDLGLANGETMTARDDRDRRVLIQGTPYGNFVAYEFGDNDQTVPPIIGGGSERLCKMLEAHSVIGAEKFTMIFNQFDPTMNIGARLEEFEMER